MGHEVDVASTAEEGLCLAAAKRPDALILDVRLPGMGGLAAMEAFRRELRGAPIIVITAFGDLATAMDAIHKGAFEYVVKPFDVAEIRAVIDRALRLEPTSNEVPDGNDAPDGMLGRSPAMHHVFKRIALAANSDAAVLLRGEGGVGKELAAAAIHRNSQRRHGPLVNLCFATLDPESMERELFGESDHTSRGGSPARSGLLLQAHGGTLFIDEVADIPIPLQLKLLRVLDHGEMQPAGADAPLRSRFRVISATRHDLQKRAEDGKLQPDLLFRLGTFEIELPPLRERLEDIRLLAQHFAAKLGGGQASFAEATFDELERRPWHGNVRELQARSNTQWSSPAAAR